MWTSPSSGADYLRLWCSHRFHEANIKATAGGKGQAYTWGQPQKGNKKCNDCNSSVRAWVSVCVFPCIYSYTAKHPPALCLFNFEANVLVKIEGVKFYTAANGMNSEALWLRTSSKMQTPSKSWTLNPYEVAAGCHWNSYLLFWPWCKPFGL